MESLQIASWNVNGWKKSCELIKHREVTVAQFLSKLHIDILCLQETKTNDSIIENDFRLLDAYSDEYETYWTCCKKRGGEKIQKGYSGLATYVGHKAKVICCCSDPFRNFFFSADGFSEGDLLVSRRFPRDNSSVSFYAPGVSGGGSFYNGGEGGGAPRQIGPPGAPHRRASDLFNEGRVLITIHQQFVLVNVYAPYSGCNYNRLDYKMRFLHAVRCKLLELRITTGLPIILVGDLNISFRNRDVHYLNNVVNLEELQKRMNKVSIREELKQRISRQIPLIIQTLSNRDNFLIKKQKAENGESFRLYLKFNGEVKRVGASFTSMEEIFFFFSLDPVFVEDKYAGVYPNDFFFSLRAPGGGSGGLGSGVGGNEGRESEGIVHSGEDHSGSEHSGEDHNGEDHRDHRDHRDVYHSFAKENERVCSHLMQKENAPMEDYLLRRGEENVKHNLKSATHGECRRLLCRYSFQSCAEGRYNVKRANTLYLKHLNDILISLGTFLSKEDLLNLANAVGHSSSPECCTNFVKNLICEDRMVDTFSFFYPSLNGKFTCWDTYKQHRISNEGSRIDYIFVDYVLYARLIRGHPHLYASPVVLTDELRGWLRGEAVSGKSNEVVATDGGATSPRLLYLWVNSPENNCNYANYFNRLKKKTGRVPTEEGESSGNEDDVYHFQFKLPSYIGFIYTSPRLSDHIAVNCTFMTKAKSGEEKEKRKKRDIPICFSEEATIPLRSFCSSAEQYTSLLPLYLIETPLFSKYAFKCLHPVHARGGTCPSVARAQPHKKTSKITQYFSIKRGKR
ncbi:exodeoxyribonuclease III [Plasmodium vivax India VII]|uniref:Exodeoxyribonuclease III n=1 Tax=Plasmodium vivax India VII TaxID=1077284 RepID=A0A0J9S717_PLAVI|nr:exodeoxyribonuclease III [Plasmodium vivax India VII]